MKGSSCALALEDWPQTDAAEVYELPTPRPKVRPSGFVVPAASDGAMEDATTEAGPRAFEVHDLQDFILIAETFPQELATLARSGELTPAQLTFCAEAIGRVGDAALALALLDDLASHPSALVREGAIYGLGTLGGRDAQAILRRVAEDDPMQFLRGLAAEEL